MPPPRITSIRRRRSTVTVRHALQRSHRLRFGVAIHVASAIAASGIRRRAPQRPAGDLPWFDAPLPPPLDDAVEDEVALDTLRRFLCDPAGQFLAQSLGLRLADEVEGG